MKTRFSGSVLEKIGNSRTLTVAFSSYDEHRGANGKFDFYGLTRRNDTDVILVRDVVNSWYFSIDASDRRGNTRAALMRYLSEITIGYDRVICLGTSMGAFGAIAFGAEIGADIILAFSPQINISLKSLDSFGNYNFRREMEMINAMSWTAPYLDLSKITTRKGRNIHAFFGKSDEFDIHLIEMVRPNPHFDIIPLDHVNHGLIHALNASGVTPKILDEAIIHGRIFQPSAELAAFREKLNHSFTLEMPIRYDDRSKKITAAINIGLDHPDFWMENARPNVLVKIRNDTLREDVLWQRHYIAKDRFRDGKVRYEIDIDTAALKPGLQSLQLALSFSDLITLDIGYSALYFQFDLNSGDIRPVSLVRTGGRAHDAYQTRNFWLA